MMNFSSSYSAGGEPHEVVQHGSAGTFQLSLKSWSIVGQLEGVGVGMISRLAYMDPHNIYVDMPKQNDQKCNKCRQKRQHALGETLYIAGFVPLAETWGFFWSSPKGTIQNRAAERTRCGGGHRGAQIYALLHLGTWRSILKNCFGQGKSFGKRTETGSAVQNIATETALIHDPNS